MRILGLGIVVGFPVLDLWLTAKFAERSGIPIWAWLLAGAAAGMWLLHSERLSFRSKTLASMHAQQSLLRSLLDSGRKVLAGLLLVFPGLLTDLVALALLALPINLGPRLRPQAAGAAPGGAPSHHTLEGEFRRLD